MRDEGEHSRNEYSTCAQSLSSKKFNTDIAQLRKKVCINYAGDIPLACMYTHIIGKCQEANVKRRRFSSLRCLLNIILLFGRVCITLKCAHPQSQYQCVCEGLDASATIFGRCERSQVTHFLSDRLLLFLGVAALHDPRLTGCKAYTT